MKRSTLIIAFVAIVALVLVGGFYYGNQKGRKEGTKATEEKLKPIIDLAYPQAEKIDNLTGIVKTVYGAEINFEITDLSDYLPHPDGSPQKKQMRAVSISRFTVLVAVALDKQGNPKSSPIKMSDIKIGDTITVWSDQNLKDAKKFDATRIELLKF